MIGGEMITYSDVADVLGRWWVNYDEGHFDVLRSLLTDDTHFTCRSATGECAYEEFIRADVTGIDGVMAWQTQHRLGSPYPLRHSGTNYHIVERGETSSTFSSYLVVTHMVNGAPALLPAGIVNGRVTAVDGVPKIAEMHVVLDTEDSVLFSERQAP
jgi:hypothetical protein